MTANPADVGRPVVNLRGVGKTFGAAASPVVALADISLQIGRGEFVSLIGPSGCGKSTLLRLIGDLTEATTGTVEINGKPARQARLDRDYGIVWLATTYGTNARSISRKWTKTVASATPRTAPMANPVSDSRIVKTAWPMR